MWESMYYSRTYVYLTPTHKINCLRFLRLSFSFTQNIWKIWLKGVQWNGTFKYGLIGTIWFIESTFVIIVSLRSDDREIL